MDAALTDGPTKAGASPEPVQKFCVDCAFHWRAVCWRPTGKLDAITGEYEPIRSPCSWQREGLWIFGGACGPDAKFFKQEVRPKPPRGLRPAPNPKERR